MRRRSLAGLVYLNLYQLPRAAQVSMSRNHRHREPSNPRRVYRIYRSASRMTRHRAASLHFGRPRAILALQHIERLEGIAIVVEADRAAQSLEIIELDEVIPNRGAVRFKVFRLAGHAGFPGGCD